MCIPCMLFYYSYTNDNDLKGNCVCHYVMYISAAHYTLKTRILCSYVCTSPRYSLHKGCLATSIMHTCLSCSLLVMYVRSSADSLSLRCSCVLFLENHIQTGGVWLAIHDEACLKGTLQASGAESNLCFYTCITYFGSYVASQHFYIATYVHTLCFQKLLR